MRVQCCRSFAFFSFAALMTGCGAATVAPAPPTAERTTETSTFVARIVRQDRAQGWVQSDVEVGATGRRVLRQIAGEVSVIDPATGIVRAQEHLPQLMAADLDPTLDQLCTITGEALAPSMGVFVLSTRSWRWTHPVEPSGTPVAAIALGDLCIGQFRGRDGDRLMAFDLATGEPHAIDVPPLEISGEGARRVLWSSDHAHRYYLRHAQSGTTNGWHVQLRDGRTFAPGPSFWANCVDVSEPRDRVGFGDVENEERRRYLRSVIDADWVECASPEADEGALVEPPLPAPWVPTGDGRLVHHDETGLYVIDWAHHQAPVRLSDMPVLRYRNLDLMMRPLDPVVGDTWVGIVDADGDLVRFDLSSGARLPSIQLPPHPTGGSRDVQSAQWQGFVGADDDLMVTREVVDGRAAFVRVGEAWSRVPANAYIGVLQSADWSGDSWLLHDPHYGLYVVDRAGSTASAGFHPPESYARISRPVRSPDGTRIAVIVGDWNADGADGVYVLDAATLSVIAHHPGDASLCTTLDVLDWDERGIVVAGRYEGVIVEPVWIVVDPQTGARRTLGAGYPRSRWGYQRRGELHVFRSWYDDAVVSVGAIDAAPVRVSIESDGASVETPDGHVWCHGALCDRYRCVVDADTIASIDDPACAHLR